MKTTTMTATDGMQIEVGIPYIIRVYADYVRSCQKNGVKSLSLDEFIAAGM